MDMTASLLYEEVQKIFEEKGSKRFAFYDAEVHTPTKTIEVYRVLGIYRQRFYDGTAYTDQLTMDILLKEGEYEHDIIPFREKGLEISIIKRPLDQIGASPDKETPAKEMRFRVGLNEQSSKIIEGNTANDSDRRTMDLKGFKNVTIGLQDLTVEQLKMVDYGFTLRDMTTIDAIRFVLGMASKQISGDSRQKIRGVDVNPGFIETPRAHIQLPLSKSAVEIPKYINDRCGGVYSTGFAYYLQDGMWYVYSPFDLHQYKSSKRSLTIANFPANRFVGIEATWRSTKDQLFVIATGETKHYDPAEKVIANKGNGIRFVDGSKIMDGFIQVDGNKFSVSSNDNTVEMVVKKQETGLQNVRLGPTPISFNIPQEKAIIASQQGATIAVTWKNAEEDQVYPGMPVKYIYEENGLPQLVTGRVISANFRTYLEGPVANSTKHVTDAVLVLFVNRGVTISKTEERIGD